MIRIKNIRDGKRATLEEVSAYGVYTLGIQVKGASGKWIGLKPDLKTLKGLSARFRKR